MSVGRPLTRVVRGASTTPDALLDRLRRDGNECVLLESADTGSDPGRYSFVAAFPLARLCALDGRVVEEREGRFLDRGPSLLRALDRFAVREGLVEDPSLPPFVSGAVGFLAYDAARQFEKIPDRHRREGAIPDALFLLFDAVAAFDHAREEWLLVSAPDGPDSGTKDRLDALQESLEEAVRPPGVEPGGSVGPMRPSAPPEDFLGAVARAKEEILAGEVYQVVLSRRWKGETGTDPLEVYRALRRVNPSPYMFYLQTREATVFGASPEALVRCRGRAVEARPIAGTAPRGEDEAEDRALAERLLADPKERAEHVMLVDLARNDLGRVCEIGTVRVHRYAAIEKYSHVQHIVSDVRGTLAPEKTSVDALEASFPAGTLTGAPKIRAMELIDELEPFRRGIYGGAIGYLDVSGNLDMAIAIRTAVVEEGTFCVQAGAGIVADSVPEKELAETEAKAAALLRSIELAGDRGAPRFPIPDSRFPTS